MTKTRELTASDCTAAQLEAAYLFLNAVCVNANGVSMDDTIVITVDALVIFLAWYGAIRFQDSTVGNGTLDAPGACVAVGEVH